MKQKFSFCHRILSESDHLESNLFSSCRIWGAGSESKTLNEEKNVAILRFVSIVHQKIDFPQIWEWEEYLLDCATDVLWIRAWCHLIECET